MKHWIALTLAVALALAVTTRAEEPQKPAARPDPQAAQDAWMKAATPGEPHHWLARGDGTWDAKVTMWMEPGKPPTVADGVSENRMILDGRWQEQRFESTMMGQPFHGLGHTGYDNVKKKFVSTWMDTTTTSVMISEGTLDASGKVLTSTSSADDPLTGKSTPVRTVATIQDDDHQLFEMFMVGPDGKLTKSMEILYSRRK